MANGVDDARRFVAEAGGGGDGLHPAGGEPAAEAQMSEPSFEGWAVLELMGDRRLGGYVRESTLAGGAFLRIDLPADGARPPMTQFYRLESVYCLTPCNEEVARAEDRASLPEPMSSRYELSLPRSIDELDSDHYGEGDEG